MKRVLIIAYYWPPSAGSGVQRWLKFSKYLPKNSWQPVIYTPENPDFSLQDKGLLSEIPKEVEVIKNKIWEPYQIGRKLFGEKKTVKNSTGIVSQEKKGFKSYLSNWIRGNVFIPDPKVYWRVSSVKFLLNYLENNPVDVIVSTGTPHSMHLIALDLKKKLGIPWVADFRDPMSQLDMLKSYHILPFRFKKYLAIERSILESANIVTTTSEVWKKDFENLGAKKAVCITNGFDESDFRYKVEPYSDFVISHFGLLNHLRNPKPLWEALSELCDENKDFDKALRIHLGGSIDPSNIAEIKSYSNLAPKLKVFEYLTHQDVIKEYLKSSVLLLLLFNSKSGIGNIPGKLFEYLAAKKTILAFGPGDGDSRRIIEECKAGAYFGYSVNDTTKIKEKILQKFKEESCDIFDKKMFNSYSRKNLTKRLSNLLLHLNT